MRPRCRVCGSRRCTTPLERERAKRVRAGLRVAALRVLARRAAPVLSAAERYLAEYDRDTDEHTVDEHRDWAGRIVAAHDALLAAVRARREVSRG